MPSEHQISSLALVALSGCQSAVFTVTCSPTTLRHHPTVKVILSLQMHLRETGVLVAKNALETRRRTLRTNSRAPCSPTTRLHLHLLGLPTTSRTNFVPFVLT